MKKTAYILVAALMTASTLAGAQTLDDALTFANNDYYGTARTIGMGNAVTATGGDLGTIAFNPAGSAVASYSQVSVTPGLSVSMTKGRFADSPTNCGSATGRNTQTRFIVPNAGVNIAFDTHNDRGIKRVSFGYTMNASDFSNDAFNARRDGFGSFAGRLAVCAKGKTPYDLENYLAGDDLLSLAYRTSAINTGNYLPANSYMGITENLNDLDNKIYAQRIGQEYIRSTYGNKLDHLLNIAFNVSDILYVGVNLGMVTTSYTMKETITESDVKGVVYDFRFSSFTYRYNYTQRSTGVYGKFGFILTPFDGLRIGGAIQTPTAYNVTERFNHAMDVRWYRDDIAAHAQNKGAVANSTDDTRTTTWDYKISSPFRFNLGLAYNLGRAILLSADYEMVNYGQTRYKGETYSDELYFEQLNDSIRGIRNSGVIGTGEQPCLTTQHIARVGAEVKLSSLCRVRAGYNFQTSGMGVSTEYGVKPIKDKSADLHAVSVGLGYYSNGSFFCDIAARYTWRPQKAVQIYGEYDYLYKDPESGEVISSNAAPVVLAKRNLLTVALTLGWRF